VTEISTSGYTIRLSGDTGPFRPSLTLESEADGVALVRLRLESPKSAPLQGIVLSWQHPLVRTHNVWYPGCGPNRSIRANWGPTACRSKNTSQAPVMCLYGTSGRNALTFALSDCQNTAVLSAGVVEETGMGDCHVRLLEDPLPPVTCYEVTLRLDSRPVLWSQALQDVSRWWESLPGLEPCAVPEEARLPLYSSWYSFHQNLSPEGLEAQCRLAAEVGMQGIIVDDGWQTDDTNRGYEYCGDWEVTERKLPDFRAHVQRVHALGMKYVLWFSVPFVGVHSRAYARFHDKLLNPNGQGTFVLDPRFPEVRQYLTDIYQSFIRRYDIDGFKLDFVDSFNAEPAVRDQTGGGRDCASVAEGADRLLSEALARLRVLKPDVLVEFRQSYIGPLMRRYGNMLRAGDVPDDFAGNRLNTVDVRLLSGHTAVHSDMVMWHRNEPVESAAMQLLHTLFAVPQVSVLLDRIPEEHRRMVRYLLEFWRENRDVLLDGEFLPQSPELLYPVVQARTGQKLLAAVYCAGASVCMPDSAPPELILVNGTLQEGLILNLAMPTGKRQMTIRRCTGEVVSSGAMDLSAGLHMLPVPPAGVAELR